MAWISVEQTLIGKKLRVLAKSVGCSQNEAIGILINLWLWGMDNASMDGLIDGADISDIALAIKPCLSEDLEPEEVVKKLVDNGWIDSNCEELFIHDWEEYRYYCNKYVSEKKQHSKRQREYVARKRAAEKAFQKTTEQIEQKPEKPSKKIHRHLKKCGIYTQGKWRKGRPTKSIWQDLIVDGQKRNCLQPLWNMQKNVRGLGKKVNSSNTLPHSLVKPRRSLII